MAEEDQDVSEKFNAFAEKYRLSFVIPVVVLILVAFQSILGAVALAFFYVVIYAKAWALGLALIGISRVMPASVSEEARKIITVTIGILLFLGTSWLIAYLF